MSLATAAPAPLSPAWWTADPPLHPLTWRGRLAIAYVRQAVRLLGRRARADIRSPDYDWAATRHALAGIENRIAFLPRGVHREPAPQAPVPAEWFMPAERGSAAAPAGTVLYVHGGSYCLERTGLHDVLAAWLAREARCRVLTIDYRLAPEHPFPAGIDDVVGCLDWLHRHHDPARTAIVGDSAGAGLALAALLRRRDAGGPLPAAYVALCPWADLTFSGASIIDNARNDPFMSDLEMISGLAELYLRGAPPGSRYASPALADLAGMPDTLVHAGRHDMLVDDARAIVNGIRRGGGRARLELWTRMPHVWQRLGSLIPEARISLEAIGAFVRERLTVGAPVA